MRKTLFFTLVAAFVLLPVTHALAARDAEQGFQKSLEGAVKNVRTNMITISTSMAREGQRNQDVTLEVNPQTKLEEIASLETLKRGDQVRVQYKEEGDKKIATSIAKLEAGAQQPGAQQQQQQRSQPRNLGS